ncbi:carboxypeptidase-like regulatory domain-containing protein [Sneathiella sp.]|uniref:carboxypeptidase-like regulatory domain-containing protein n=1 Tax=Sneathiella sp. TaxID=1964365 RepID=UPI0039E26775
MSDNRQIHVIVQDMSGNRLQNATVVIERTPFPVEETSKRVSAKGEVDFNIKAIGLYELSCHAAGFEPTSITAMITDTPVSLVLILLRPADV